MNNILNRTKTEWIIINLDDEIWVGHDHSYWLPLSELNNSRVAIKSYRGRKSAINGVLQSGGCSEDDIRNNRIRVLPVTTLLQVDENYIEEPVSNYFKDLEIKRYIKTKQFKLIIDLADSTDTRRFRLSKQRFGSEISTSITWYDTDKYGRTHEYWDEVIASSDSRKDLEND